MKVRTTSGKGLQGPSSVRIVMLCAGAFAVETAYQIEEGYALPAMLAAGLPETVASAMWAVGPVLGLFFQGYLGSASDRCTCTWGKRRPFIVGLAVCACLAILLFPYGAFLSGTVLGLSDRSGGLFIMVFTASAFVAMDFFLDALQSPLRAYLLDSVPTERSEQANYTFTALLCGGAIAGSLIAGIPWSRLGSRDGANSSTRSTNRQLEAVYGIATVIFALCILLCLNSIRERNPVTHGSPSVEKELSLPLVVKHKSALVDLAKNNIANIQLTSLKQPHTSQIVSSDDLNHPLSKLQLHEIKPANGVHYNMGPSAFPQLTLGGTHVGTKKTTESNCLSRFFAEVYEDICGTILFSKHTSLHFSRLCWTVFFTWVTFLSMLLYFTSFMGEVVYGGSPHATSGEKERELFEHGVRIGFLMMLFQDIVSTTSCLSMKKLSDHLGIRRLFVGGLAAYVVVCFAAAVWPSLLSVTLLQLVAGLVYSNMQSLPYTLISHYEVYISSGSIRSCMQS